MPDDPKRPRRSPPIEDFEQVLGAARDGDHDAFASLYRALSPVVLGYLRGQGASEPEDLTSEVFAAMVRGLDRFHGDEDGFRAWVFTIAHRRLTDERRRRGRRRTDPADPARLGLAPDPGTPAPDEDVLERLAPGPAVEALASLTEAQRTVVLLRVVADLPVAQVARVVGKREGAVKTLQRRALAALARTLSRGPVS